MALLTFVKAQASSLIATIVDFLVTIVLVEILRVWYLPASVTGTITGGVVNFLLGRNWVFTANSGRTRSQAIKYLIVWNGNLFLNAAGVYLFTHFGNLQYVISKIIVSVVLGCTYNYLLQKKFVFR